jgi:hypothetical protein
MSELSMVLVKAVEAELKPLGFKLAKGKKPRARRAPSSISAAFVRAVDKRKRIEKYHLMVINEWPGYRICPSVSVRFEEVEGIFHRTSGYDSEQQEDSSTVGIDLWRVFGRNEYQIPLKDEADLATATSRVLAIFHEKAEPYFTQFSTLATVDSAINDQPGDDCVHRDALWVRCSTGLIVAKLVGRKNYDQLVSIYLDMVRSKSNFCLARFELLLSDLANPGYSPKRYDILGRKLPYPLAEYLSSLERATSEWRASDADKARAADALKAQATEKYRELGIGGSILYPLLEYLGYADALRAPTTEEFYQQAVHREVDIGASLEYAVLEHLGYGPIKDLVERLNQGVNNALDYFFGDWWKRNECDAKALDKSRPDRALAWFGVLTKGLLLCGLTGRWDDAAKICSWFDESIEMEYPAGQVGDDYMALFLCVASNLRPQPIPGTEKILARVKACRDKRPRLVCAAWEAAVASDQKAFDKALKDAVDYFLKNDAYDGPVNYWVALDQSLVWLIAERNGLKFPKLPEKLDAALVRRQTIGLAKEE